MGICSSANSINWGRLVPQIVYYFSAYCELLNAGRIKAGDAIDVAVPTGNFGNILAAWFAKHSGLPIRRLICASNRNNVLTDFIKTGTYDRNRDFFLTTSPSMDILISSNLERLLYLLCGRDDGRVRGYMQSLAKTGSYTVEHVLARLPAGCADVAQTATIGHLGKDGHVRIRPWPCMSANRPRRRRNADCDCFDRLFAAARACPPGATISRSLTPFPKRPV
ncbi:MAG: hypothetical protein ACLSDO_02305 [Anaerotruncus colihominis]